MTALTASLAPALGTANGAGSGADRLLAALRRAAVVLPAAAVAAQFGPVASSFGPLRNMLLPGLAGRGAPDHVALTLDDGPDAASTPRFLRLLAQRQVRATFFLLGGEARRHPRLVRDIAEAGHEVGVHGWEHRALLLRGPRSTYDELARVRDLLARLTGEPPQLFRPPYGVMSGTSYVAARRLGLTPVLWTAWGRDRRMLATPASVHRTVLRGLRGGGTVLLHDSDRDTAPGAWESALGALPRILDTCAERGLRVGPLAEHFASSTRLLPPLALNAPRAV